MLPSNTEETMVELLNPERTKNLERSIPSGDLLLDWNIRVNFFSVSIPETQQDMIGSEGYLYLAEHKG